MTSSTTDFAAIGRRVIRREAEALGLLAETLDGAFADAARIGRLVPVEDEPIPAPVQLVHASAVRADPEEPRRVDEERVDHVVGQGEGPVRVRPVHRMRAGRRVELDQAAAPGSGVDDAFEGGRQGVDPVVAQAPGG